MKKMEEFLKGNDSGVSREEAERFLMEESARTGELFDDELDDVAGGDRGELIRSEYITDSLCTGCRRSTYYLYWEFSMGGKMYKAKSCCKCKKKYIEEM